MRPPSLFPRGPIAASLVLAVLAGSPARAEDVAPLPTCQPTVPVPPPEPPARPEALTGQPQPSAAVPLPPERPAELSSAPPATQDASPPAPPLPERPADDSTPKAEPPPNLAAPAPLPPVRPPELSSAPVPPPDVIMPPPSPELPRCVTTQEAPVPPARPPELSASPATLPDAPQPPTRPPELSAHPETSEETPLPPTRPAELSGEAALKLTIAPPDDAECLRNLDGLGVKYQKMTPIVNGQCSIANPLTVSALGNGIAIGPPQTMVCRLAEGLMRWTAEVQQTAEKELGDTLKGFTLGGTYVCRGQNHGAEAQLSEHAFANAVDVMGFTFAKRAPIAVGKLPEGSKEAVFLAAVRTKACDLFTTVLGPGSDEAHGNHLHLDERERKVGYRLCQ